MSYSSKVLRTNLCVPSSILYLSWNQLNSKSRVCHLLDQHNSSNSISKVRLTIQTDSEIGQGADPELEYGGPY